MRDYQVVNLSNNGLGQSVAQLKKIEAECIHLLVGETSEIVIRGDSASRKIQYSSMDYLEGKINAFHTLEADKQAASALLSGFQDEVYDHFLKYFDRWFLQSNPVRFYPSKSESENGYFLLFDLIHIELKSGHFLPTISLKLPTLLGVETNDSLHPLCDNDYRLFLPSHKFTLSDPVDILKLCIRCFEMTQYPEITCGGLIEFIVTNHQKNSGSPVDVYKSVIDKAQSNLRSALILSTNPRLYEVWKTNPNIPINLHFFSTINESALKPVVEHWLSCSDNIARNKIFSLATVLTPRVIEAFKNLDYWGYESVCDRICIIDKASWAYLVSSPFREQLDYRMVALNDRLGYVKGRFSVVNGLLLYCLAHTKSPALSLLDANMIATLQECFTHLELAHPFRVPKQIGRRAPHLKILHRILCLFRVTIKIFLVESCPVHAHDQITGFYKFASYWDMQYFNALPRGQYPPQYVKAMTSLKGVSWLLSIPYIAKGLNIDQLMPNLAFFSKNTTLKSLTLKLLRIAQRRHRDSLAQSVPYPNHLPEMEYLGLLFKPILDSGSLYVESEEMVNCSDNYNQGILDSEYAFFSVVNKSNRVLPNDLRMTLALSLKACASIPSLLLHVKLHDVRGYKNHTLTPYARSIAKSFAQKADRMLVFDFKAQ